MKRSFIPAHVVLAVGLARALVKQPRLWPTALVQALRFVPVSWWRRPPFLPLPDAGLVKFRSEAMYGDPQQRPKPADVITWFRWCRAQNREARSRNDL